MARSTLVLVVGAVAVVLPVVMPHPDVGTASATILTTGCVENEMAWRDCPGKIQCNHRRRCRPVFSKNWPPDETTLGADP